MVGTTPEWFRLVPREILAGRVIMPADQTKLAPVVLLTEFGARKILATESVVGQTVRVQTTRFDREHGSVYDAWVAMGAPQHILPADLEVLRQRMELDVSVRRVATPANTLEWTVAVQPFGVTLLEIHSE